MNLKTMEGLLGAGTNIKMTEVPMRVYREAERRGDIATMNRSMGYAAEFTERAGTYKKEAERGMKEEKEELREKEKRAREEALEKKREEEKRVEKGENRNEPADPDNHQGSEITERNLTGQAEAEQQKGTPLMYTQTGMGITAEHPVGISVLK